MKNGWKSAKNLVFWDIQKIIKKQNFLKNVIGQSIFCLSLHLNTINFEQKCANCQQNYVELKFWQQFYENLSWAILENFTKIKKSRAWWLIWHVYRQNCWNFTEILQKGNLFLVFSHTFGQEMGQIWLILSNFGVILG